MKKLISTLLFLFFIGSAFAQKVVNDPNVEPRTVSSFHAVHVSSAFSVIITQGNDESLAVSANDKEDVQHIKTVVENGILKIWLDEKGKWFKNHKLRAYISVKNLDELKASGACNIKIDGQISASSMKIDLSGASDLTGKLVVSGKMDIDLSGASDVDMSGSASEVTIDASGASNIKSYDFRSTVCSIDASGACDVHLTVDKEISAKLSGASSVSYKGTALIKDIKVSGSSSISRKS
jgi:hypothetical protein